MAKRNKSMMNNGQSNKRKEIERLKAEATKNKVVSEKERKQAIIEKFGLEDAEIFMKQEEIISREKAIALKEKEFEEQENQLKVITSDIEARTKAIEKKESEIINKERSLIERENNAENEFAIQNKKALEVLLKRTEELKTEIQNLEQEKVDKEKNLTEEIAVLRTKKIELADVEVNAYYDSRKKEIDAELVQMQKTGKDKIANEISLLEEQKKAVADTQKALNASIIKYQEKLRNLENREEDLNFNIRMFEENQKINKQYIENEVKNRVDMFRNEMESAIKSAKYYKKLANSKAQKLSEYE